jgi:predicted RNA-binding Zn-ribbon protein involved in translation (DUF1610 family)
MHVSTVTVVKSRGTHLLLLLTTMSSPMSVEHILSPSSEDTPRAPTPPQKPKGGSKPKRALPGDVELSVFDIHNIFRRRWFLSRDHLLTNVISAQKAEDGNISWVEFTPQYHSHLVKCAVALVPHPVAKVKKVMFVYILELLNREGHVAFFELQKGGRKANNAQKEKRRLARKRSRAAKREREREAAKAAKQPPRERQCEACGRKFKSRKTASKHKCPKSKVARVPREAASEQASQATSQAKLDKPAAQITSHTPTAPPNINSPPAVTGDSRGNSQVMLIIHIQTGRRRKIFREEWQRYWETGLWRLG